MEKTKLSKPIPEDAERYSELIQFRVTASTDAKLKELAKRSRRKFAEYMRLLAEDSVKTEYQP